MKNRAQLESAEAGEIAAIVPQSVVFEVAYCRVSTAC
jgi:hypothetical protein